MVARGKMDGAWAFWQHRERTRKDRDAGRIRKRERESRWCLEVLLKERRAVGERNASRPRTSTSSVLLPSVLFVLSRYHLRHLVTPSGRRASLFA